MGAIVAGVVCVVLAGYLALAARDEHRVQDANRAGVRADYRRVTELAGTVHRAPAAARARLLEAYAAVGRRDWPRAFEQFAAAAAAAPNDWELRRDWALTLGVAGEPAKAQKQLQRALALNPRMRVPQELRRPLPASR